MWILIIGVPAVFVVGCYAIEGLRGRGVSDGIAVSVVAAVVVGAWIFLWYLALVSLGGIS